MKKDITFIVTEDEAGGYSARALGYSIFTQGETREEVERMVRDAVRCHFDSESDVPRLIHLHYVHDEVIAL